MGEFFSQEGVAAANMFRGFLSLFDFGPLLLDQALREVLKKIELPKEAQQIDRILNGVSKEYHQSINGGRHNPPRFREVSAKLSEDLVYQLAFSLMMIQTCEYNRNVEDKISLEKYQNSLEFVDNFKLLKSSGFLRHLYESVRNESLIPLRFMDKKSKERARNRGGVHVQNMFARTVKLVKAIRPAKVDMLRIESDKDELGVVDLIFEEFCGMKLFNELIIAYQKENVADVLG